MFLPITSLALLGCYFLTRGRVGGKNTRDPLLFALRFWIIADVLMMLPVLKYDVQYSSGADGFVAETLIAVTAGYLVARRGRDVSQSAVLSSRDAEANEAGTYILAAVGTLGLLMVIVGTGGSLSLSQLAKNLSSIHDDALTSAGEGGGSKLAGYGTVLAGCSFLTMVAYGLFASKTNSRMRFIGVSTVALIAFVSFFVYAGRATLIYAILLFVTSTCVGGRKVSLLRPRTLVTLAVVATGALYLAVPFIALRLPELNNDPAHTLLRVEHAEYHPLIANSANTPSVNAALLSYGYFSSSLPTIAWYLDQHELPGPYWGAYTFKRPVEIIRSLTGISFADWTSARTDIFNVFEDQGYYGNIWPTWLRDLTADFGRTGCLVFCAMYGWLLGWARRRFLQRRTLHIHLLQTLLCFGFAWGAFTDAIGYVYLDNALVALAVMMILRPIWTRSAGALVTRVDELGSALR